MDFASDANPHKDVARAMMRMTREINTEALARMEGLHGSADPTAGPANWRVTCWTCHRGQAQPEARPPVAPEVGPPPGMPAPADSARGRSGGHEHRHPDGTTHHHDGR